jgi:hypothetical protein
VAEAVDDMIAQIWADGGALTGLVNNAAGNFISRTKDLSPRGFNAIADIVFRGSFYMTLACGKRWIEAGNRERHFDPHDLDLERRPVHRAVRHVEGRPQHHDEIACDRMGAERHPAQRDRAGPLPHQRRVGAAQSQSRPIAAIPAARFRWAAWARWTSSPIWQCS